MKWLALSLALLLFGCASKQAYIEGTHCAVGAYLPWEESLYGVQILQYTSGAYLTVTTNNHVKFERDYGCTNSYFWGMVKTCEWSKSKLELPQKNETR